MDKIVKYEVKLSVPQSQVSQHQKKFENILHTAINKGLKGTDLVSVVKVTKRPFTSFLNLFILTPEE